jgi:hypothetical protein
MEVLFAWLFTNGLILIIELGVAFVSTVIGLFVGNIIVFDSIALAIVGGSLAHGLLHIHPAFCLVIGIGILIVMLFLLKTKVGFWVIGVLLSLLWGVVFGVLALIFSNDDPIWCDVIFVLGTLLSIGLHIRARNQKPTITLSIDTDSIDVS